MIITMFSESSMGVSIKAQEESSEYRSSVQFLCEILIERAFNAFYMHHLLFYFHPKYKDHQKSLKTIHTFDQTVISERRKLLQDAGELDNEGTEENAYGEKKRTPFLDILLRAKEENGEPLSDKSIRHEVDGIMFAVNKTLNLYNFEKTLIVNF